MKKAVRVALSMGDPAGIGPEVLVKALRGIARSEGAVFYLIGDSRVLARSGFKPRPDAVVVDLKVADPRQVRPGVPSLRAGQASLACLDEAVRLIKRGACQALVTAPISKESARAAGFSWPGHTEFLTEAFGVRQTEMVFVSKKLKVALVTRHMALREAVRNLSADRIVACGRLIFRSLKEHFRIRDPRIAVSGLNPHAGERGLMGSEEETFIGPAVQRLNAGLGEHFFGPFSPDTLFPRAVGGAFDAVMAMYHDQGLIPFKMVSFRDGVNLTVGLPFIRTSPVHGTAFEIAGKGKADPHSMAQAVRLACKLARNLPG